MKRKCSDSSIRSRDFDSRNYSSLFFEANDHRSKVRNFASVKVPSSLKGLDQSNLVNEQVLDTLDDVINVQMFNYLPKDEIVHLRHDELKFLLFLGVVGKNVVQDIKENLPALETKMIIVSSGFDEKEAAILSSSKCYVTDDDQCQQLSKYFKVLDPLGGGIYPLDFLLVIDSRGYLRSQIPIRICLQQRYNPHETFGVDMENLTILLQEYKEYFTFTNLSSCSNEYQLERFKF